MAEDFLKADNRRDLIDAERHSRPPLPALAPSIFQHIVLHGWNKDLAEERRACLTICENLGLIPDSGLNDQIKATGDGIELKWERHTEFSSFTILQRNVRSAKDFVPWSERDLGWEYMPGKLLVSLLIGLESENSKVWSGSELFKWQNGSPLCASSVMSDTTIISSDMDLDARGNARLLVKTSNKEPTRLGRLVQRLVEIETYGALTLYAWKDVKEIGPRLEDAESWLEGITSRLTKKHGESDEQMLADLSELSAYQEATTSRSHFRLNASLAYYDIVVRRLGELHEGRVEGRQRFANFLLRRMDPAARTYRSILTRQQEIAERISRATHLLRGRTDVAIAKQNQQLLQSMNERAEAQYKLQKTVEGLSVVAISYYALGILSYLAALLAGYVPGLGVKEIIGLSVPIVIFLVWLGIRKIRE